MGNTDSSSKSTTVKIPHQQQIEQLFQNLCDNGILNKGLFENHFNGATPVIRSNLFNHYFIDLLNSNTHIKQTFVERVHTILETAYKSLQEQNQFYCDLMTHNEKTFHEKDVRKVIIDCCIMGLQQVTDGTADEILDNDHFITGLTNSCMNGAESISRDDFVTWTCHSFPTIFAGLQAWLHYKFTSIKSKGKIEMLVLPNECSSSRVMLTSSLLWYLCCMLPSCFTSLQNKFKIQESDDTGECVHNDDVIYTWNLLYDSNQHGLSLNRFKHKVMDYKSPTVTLLEFSDSLTIALALDQPWKDSAEKFGGPYCQLIELYPQNDIIDANSKMVYLKEIGRAIPTGLIIGSNNRPKLKIDTDLSTAELNFNGVRTENIERFEVWGCGGVEAIRSQADLKKWERNEIEKRKKVKLPGQWDTDKSILEMGGVRVNHSERGDI